MEQHILEPRPDAVHDYFSADLAPVLRVASGDTVIVRTLDARGHRSEPDGPSALLPGTRGHALCGPIYVEGARPSTAIAVRLVKLTTDAWGWTEAGGDETFTGCLGISTGETAALLWRLDPESRTGTSRLGFAVDLHPFLGVIGLAPAAPGEHSTTPPRLTGGNIDCKDLVVGSVLYLPVSVDGGLLSVGDGHARQGDGEVSGTAIECGMTSELELTVVDHPLLPTPYASTATSWITFGFDPDLNAASAAATSAMLTLMQRMYTLTRTQALALASVVVDLRVTQVANGAWGVHAVLPKQGLRPL
jgi:acetamidase/formamidase